MSWETLFLVVGCGVLLAGVVSCLVVRFYFSEKRAHLRALLMSEKDEKGEDSL
jgi:hypothetical protein